ncbi:MAG: hypothetical protein QXE31_06095 [Candidatus Woesearchaeota archaeon]
MNYLNDVPEGKEFYLFDRKIKNLYGLLFELRSMNDETYNHFVASDHNYFSDWIEHVIQFKKLADELRPIVNRKEAINIIEKNIDDLKNSKEGINKLDEKKSVFGENKIENISENVIKESEKKVEKYEEKEEKNELKNLLKEEKESLKKELPTKQEKSHEKDVKDYKINSEELLKETLKHDAKYGKDFLWKHFAWEMAKEFMYGMSLGILIGFILARIFIRCI